jgi:hypothetical protein
VSSPQSGVEWLSFVLLIKRYHNLKATGITRRAQALRGGFAGAALLPYGIDTMTILYDHNRGIAAMVCINSKDARRTTLLSIQDDDPAAPKLITTSFGGAI